MAELLANKSVFTMDGSHAPSCVTSVFNSASGVYVDELRATRKTINVDRRKLEAWFTRLAGPEAKQADIEDEFSDHDLARNRLIAFCFTPQKNLEEENDGKDTTSKRFHSICAYRDAK